MSNDNPTSKELMTEVLWSQDQVTAVRGEAMTPELVRDAVAEGVRRAVADPQMWASALQAMQKHAQTEAGGWMFGWIKAIASKALLFLVIGLGVYAIGGWSALAALFKTTTQP